MTDRPQSHPQTDTLTALGEADRETVLCRAQTLLPLSPTQRDRGSQSREWSGAQGRKTGRRKSLDHDQDAPAVNL